MVETTAVFLPARAELLDVGDDGLPVGMTERRVVDHDVLVGDALGLQVGLEDLVGRARIDVVGAGKHPALTLAAVLAHQVVDRSAIIKIVSFSVVSLIAAFRTANGGHRP